MQSKALCFVRKYIQYTTARKCGISEQAFRSRFAGGLYRGSCNTSGCNADYFSTNFFCFIPVSLGDKLEFRIGHRNWTRELIGHRNWVIECCVHEKKKKKKQWKLLDEVEQSILICQCVKINYYLKLKARQIPWSTNVAPDLSLFLKG